MDHGLHGWREQARPPGPWGPISGQLGCNAILLGEIRHFVKAGDLDTFESTVLRKREKPLATRENSQPDAGLV
jgi:hypothetical protein